jgi:erythromycin esterase
MYTTLNDWIARESISFSVDSTEDFDKAVDKVVASLDGAAELLGFGEALHGSEEMLRFRNRLFQRLVEAHGYSAIAVESSFPRANVVNEYVAGRGAASYEAVQESGFSHGFGKYEATRELVEWMRRYNADSAREVKLRFYGFDSPTEMMGSDSPRKLLQFVLDYLASVDRNNGGEPRQRIEVLLGPDVEWENPAANTLRIETEDLITELSVRRPELVAKSGKEDYLEAAQHASLAWQMLNYHAGLARKSDNRVAELLGLRDVMMADNLAYAVERERCRGKVFAFAHNTHLQRGEAKWQLGSQLLAWWPAGAHLNEMLGARYAVIGSGVGISEANGIGQPEAGSLEAPLAGGEGRVKFVPTRRGQGLPAEEIAALRTRSGRGKNSTYFPLTSQSLTDFDWLAVLG